MKKIKLILFYVLVFQVSYSQIMVGPSISYGVSYFNFKDLNTFTESYNEYIRQSDNYKEDMKKLRFAPVFHYGANLLLGPYHLDVDFGRSTTRRKVEFQYDEYRKFAFERNYINFYQGVGYWDEYSLFTAGLGINLVNTELQMSYVYADGFESFGEERVLNGVYNNLALKFSLGARGGIFIQEQLGVFLKVDYNFGFNDGLFPATALTDLSESTFGNGEVNNWIEMPKKYNPSDRTISEENSVKSNWGELSIKLSLVYFINLVE